MKTFIILGIYVLIILSAIKILKDYGKDNKKTLFYFALGIFEIITFVYIMTI